MMLVFLVILLTGAADATGRRAGTWTPPGYDTASVINLDNPHHIIKGRVESCSFDPVSKQYIVIVTSSDDQIAIGIIAVKRPNVEVGAKIKVFARFFIFAEMPIFYCDGWELDDQDGVSGEDRGSSESDT